jgi:hypothetical protein
VIKLETPKGYAHETNDCGVLALSALLCVEYSEAHRLLALQGRKERRGVFFKQMMHAVIDSRSGVLLDERPKLFNNLGFDRRGLLKFPTVGRVLDLLPHSGWFLVECTNHYFAVIDGVIYDNGAAKPRRKLRSYCPLLRL